MLKKHAAEDGESPATRKAKTERLSGILSLSLFLVRGRVSIETHAFLKFFPFDQKGRFSTGCITIGDVQQVDSGIG